MQNTLEELQREEGRGKKNGRGNCSVRCAQREDQDKKVDQLFQYLKTEKWCLKTIKEIRHLKKYGAPHGYTSKKSGRGRQPRITAPRIIRMDFRENWIYEARLRRKDQQMLNPKGHHNIARGAQGEPPMGENVDQHSRSGPQGGWWALRKREQRNGANIEKEEPNSAQMRDFRKHSTLPLR